MASKKGKPATGSSKPKMELATAVSERVEIETVRLLESNAWCRAVREELPGNVDIGIRPISTLDRKKGTVLVRVHLVVSAQYDTSESTEEPLRIEATFLLQYRLASTAGLRKENVEAFGELNGVFNVWPYWREYVQSMTTRMGLPSLTMPSLKLSGRPTARSSARARNVAARAKPEPALSRKS